MSSVNKLSMKLLKGFHSTPLSSPGLFRGLESTLKVYQVLIATSGRYQKLTAAILPEAEIAPSWRLACRRALLDIIVPTREAMKGLVEETSGRLRS